MCEDLLLRHHLEKSTFIVDFGVGASSPLAALLILGRLSNEGAFHVSNKLRPPLGIYNVSISRICDKVVKLATRLEQLFNAAADLDEDLPAVLVSEIVDYVELAIYAAAEHVDDLDSIATYFFESTRYRNRHPAFKTLENAIKQHKKFIAAAANAIKHQQSRIRLVATEFSHGARSGLIHSYFIEAVDEGVICASPLFHQASGLLSITNLIWEILLFVLNCSVELSTFLRSVGKENVGPTRPQSNEFCDAVKAAARLPLYSLGESHAFERGRLVLLAPDDLRLTMNSSLYGSLGRGWLHFSPFVIGRSIASFEGDGASQRFTLPLLKRIKLNHWT